ncbi:hypothetical protein F6R97_29685 [Pseudomonas sp. JV414]|uniref:hypothetical protein n=1 Tax=Pseudomonas sp. JV414 TaxID=1733110 RepID=UPI0028E13E62|nr:hypothetical protein [Pseudomonas sp. JV414]MDT9678667.1 hypothetical protein [Pseudomonas sp. JV414]
MKYRATIEEALKAWHAIRFHWLKSAESKAAANILRQLIDSSPYDNVLKQAVEWFTDQCNEAFTYQNVTYSRLKTTSALYVQLNTHLKSAEGPDLAPVASSSSSSVPTAIRMGSSVAPVSRPSSSGLGLAPASAAGLSLSSSSGVRPVELQIRKYEKLWAKITVTDIPTKKHGVYNYTKDDPITTQQKGSASGVVEITLRIAGKPLEAPEFWVLLGGMVLESTFGRCFSCAAAAVHTLVHDEYFDRCEVVIMGTKKYDHYFVCVANTLGEIKSGEGIAIDIWQANLSKKPDAYAHSPANTFRYWPKAEIICVIPQSRRTEFRELVKTRNNIEHPK